MNFISNESNVKPFDIESKKDLLKRTICKGSSDEEFELFLMACKRTGLDPFMKQIYAVPRWDSKSGKNTYTMQTSIDGFRLIAERTGNYSPGREPTYVYDDKQNVIAATAYIKKRTMDGTWHEVAATAHYDEYAQLTKDGKPTKFWNQMPHVMLAKCAESLALRKAFPADLSGIYTADEMSQAEPALLQNIVDDHPLTETQIGLIDEWCVEFPDFKKGICDRYQKDNIYLINQTEFEGAEKMVIKKRELAKEAKSMTPP